MYQHFSSFENDCVFFYISYLFSVFGFAYAIHKHLCIDCPFDIMIYYGFQTICIYGIQYMYLQLSRNKCDDRNVKEEKKDKEKDTVHETKRCRKVCVSVAEKKNDDDKKHSST